MPSQRIAFPLARRPGGPDVKRLLRRIELEYQTREEAEDIADMIAGMLPDPQVGRLGLVELLLNAVEHGNLEIGCALKSTLLLERRFEEEVALRMAREPFRSRRVHVRVGVAFPQVEIEIRDGGAGFAWRDVLAAELDASDRPNGRGVALVSRRCFPTLEYRDPGNVAIVKLVWPQ